MAETRHSNTVPMVFSQLYTGIIALMDKSFKIEFLKVDE